MLQPSVLVEHEARRAAEPAAIAGEPRQLLRDDPGDHRSNLADDILIVQSALDGAHEMAWGVSEDTEVDDVRSGLEAAGELRRHGLGVGAPFAEHEGIADEQIGGTFVA